MTPQERSLLIDALLDGDISEADFLRLEAEMSVDAAVRAEYYDRLKLQVLLQRAADENQDSMPAHRTAEHDPAEHDPAEQAPAEQDPAATAQRLTRASGYGFAAGALLAMAACLLLIVQWVRQSPSPGQAIATAASSPPAESKAVGFGLLGGQSNAEWEGTSLISGGLLPEGPLHLLSGLAHIELFSGVQMVIQGEARFSIESAMQVRVAQGRIRAFVPEAAQGFRVLTQQGQVIDLGTEFAIDVDAQSTRVNVLDGEVELHPHGDRPHTIREGQSQHMLAGDAVAEQPQSPLSIVSPHEFHKDLDSRLASRMQHWQAQDALRRQNPDLLAYYHPDRSDRWSRQMVNRSEAPAAVASDGAIVAAERTRDRWGRADGALDFSRTGSRVRVQVPGQFQDLTLLCWVKINSLDRWYNSLFLTDGHEQHEPHWQIMNDGRLFFSVKSERQASQAPSQHVFYSPSFWDASLSGKWIMLAVVYDSHAQQVTHYLDGQPLSREAIPAEYLVDTIRVGAASICNWSQPMYRTDPEFAVRNLNGSMDEFAMFSAALSDQQILEWFQAGNPHE